MKFGYSQVITSKNALRFVQDNRFRHISGPTRLQALGVEWVQDRASERRRANSGTSEALAAALRELTSSRSSRGG